MEAFSSYIRSESDERTHRYHCDVTCWESPYFCPIHVYVYVSVDCDSRAVGDK
jgi:hypothetical protein